MGNPKAALGVSIIVPAYNYAQFLPQAIDSALAQTYSPVEVIVVDDGSTDSTPEVVAQYSDPRVRYVYQKNAGLSAARNTGIGHALYDHVSFLDADDKLLPQMCERIMEAFAKLPADFALIGCRMIKMAADGTPLRSKQFGNQAGGEVTTRDFILKNRFPCNVIVRKGVFEDSGYFDTSLTSTEDRDMWIRISTKHRVFLLGEFLVLIRRHATSMSHHSDRMKLNMRRVLRKAWQSRAIPRWDLYWLKVLSFNHTEVAWMNYDERRIAKALYHLLASFVMWPVFLQPGEISQPLFFRLRSMARFLISGFASSAAAAPSKENGGAH